MLYTVEMPSFLSDDNDQIIVEPSQESYDDPRKSHDKPNGTIRHINRSAAKGSFEQSLDRSFGELHQSSATTNGMMLAESRLSSVANGVNGRSGGGSWENRSSRDGSALSVNTVVNGGSENAIKGNTTIPNNRPKTSMSTGRNSISSLSGGAVQNLPVEPSSSTKATINGENGPGRRISIPHPVFTNAQSTGPLTYTSALVPASPVPGLSPPISTASPHRYSSPPTYSSPGNADAAVPTSHSPVPPPLKHRHTLQVPRIGPPRASTDDSVYTSGRFSPTTGTGIRRASLSLVRRNTRSIHSEMPHEEILPDEDARRWAEAIRQKRASKRRRRDDEDDDRVVVGTKVDQHHVNWVTAYNMLTGIRFTVSRTNAKLDRALTDADFLARHKFSFDITGNELTPSAKYDFKFKDYAPWVFRHLRARFKLDPADYLMSLTSKYILSELGSPGKSGSFFYFSRDYKYIIKTIHHAEHKFLRKILKDYYTHVENNPNTLLSQFYGLHRVKIPYGRKIHFVVMNNLFPPHRDIHQTFDLKGSTIGRDFREEDLAHNPRATLKDLNWLRRHLHLEFGPEKKALFIEQMKRDVHLLQKLKIMDYSMLVGIHDLEKGNEENLRDKTLRVFQPGGDLSPIDDTPNPHAMLIRTPSKMETARKARELRQIIKQEKPVPMGQTLSRMPDQMEENAIKKDFTFYSDDGGFQATHHDNRPGDVVYYLGIIDCLTHYGTVKRLEHFWKGLSHDKKQISPVPSMPYGDRFIEFIDGVTMTKEEAAERDIEHQGADRAGIPSLDGARPGDNYVIQQAEHQALKTERRGASEDLVPDRTLTTVRSPSAERSHDRNGMTLPIVDEVGESSSTGGRSGRSGRSIIDDREERPATPLKDDDPRARPATPAKDGASLYVPNHIPRSRASSRASSLNSNKALPPLPLSASSQPMNEKENFVK